MKAKIFNQFMFTYTIIWDLFPVLRRLSADLSMNSNEFSNYVITINVMKWLEDINASNDWLEN